MDNSITPRLRIIFALFIIISATSLSPCDSSQRLPTDVNFVRLSRSPVYVDKTNFLRTFFNNKTIHNFVTCPRRFGKTTMLQMIRKFAEIEVDRNKKKFFWKDTYAYTVFQNLSIGQYPSLMAQHLAHYVVITLNLDMDEIKRPNERKLMRFLYEQIAEKYQRYQWILEGDYKIDGADARYMKKVLNNTLNKLEETLCLFRLAKILHNVYDNTKVIILVDDYDSAFTELVYQPDFGINKYYKMLNNLLSRTFTVGREYIDYVLVTGTSSMSYYLDQEKIQAIRHRPFLEDHPMSTLCGVSEKNLAPVLEEHEFDDVERFKLKECYDGYTTRVKHRTIYNPNSVRKYLESGRKPVSKFWKERFQNNVNYFPRPKELDRYWTIENRDFIIFQFFCFPEFFGDIAIPANTENAEESNFTLSKTYRSNAVDKFTVLVQHILNYWNEEPNLAEKRRVYLPLIRTFVFEHGYFTHSRKRDGFYGVPNCEVRMEVALNIDNFNLNKDSTKFI